MRKIITSLLLFMFTAVLFSACNTDPPIDKDVSEYELWLASAPVATDNVIPLNSDMSALEMFDVANNNTDLADWVTLMVIGEADTSVKIINSTLDVIQAVSTHKILDNQNGQSYISTTSATIEAPSAIMGLNIAVLEHTYKDAAGEIFYRKGNKPKVNSNGDIVADEYSATVKYNNLADYMDKYINNPFIYGMYNVDEDTIIADECLVSKSDDYYTVTIVIDPEYGTDDYVEVMEYMIGVPASVKFQHCKLIYEIWNNGLIRSVRVQEDYNMKILGIINGTVALDTIAYYNYDRATYNINDYKFS